jgi:hypothetical protein
VNLASFSWRSKGSSVFVKRIPLVFQRFGFREKKIASYLNKIVSVCEQHNVSPTLTITSEDDRKWIDWCYCCFCCCYKPL